MSKIVGVKFNGVGVDVNQTPFEVDPARGEFPDEVLGRISGAFSVVHGDGRMIFGIEPAFAWEYGGDEMPKSLDEARSRVAEALSGVLVKYDNDDEPVPVTADDVLPYVSRFDDSWVELW